MDHLVHRALQFDRFTLDLARGCLRVGDQEIDLRPKTFEVLCYFAENAGRLVPKQEVFKAVWPNVTVCDDSLVQCIRELRQKLGDNDHRLIKTVSRRGYLLNVTALPQVPHSSSDKSATRPAETPRKPRTKPHVLLSTLRTIRVHKLRMWSAAAACFTCIAFGALHLFGPLVLVGNTGSVLAENTPLMSEPRPTFQDCGGCPSMVVLPVGEFMMGSPPLARDVGAVSPKRVAIKNPMAIGKFEVTVDQFSTFVAETRTSAGTLCRAIVGDTGSAPYRFVLGPPEASFRAPGFAVTGTHPAVCVNWYDAQEYVAWLRTRTGRPYRLPTDAEWEYAARAGTPSYYSFGNDAAALCGHGRFANLDSPFPWRNGCGNDTASPIPVGQLKPNPWGIFDMYGNAWELVEGCWTTNASYIPNDGSAFSPAGGCATGVMRGGSWANFRWELGSPVRRAVNLAFRGSQVGFRVALSLAE